MRRFLVTVNGRTYEVELEEVTAFPQFGNMGSRLPRYIPPASDAQPAAIATAPEVSEALPKDELSKPVAAPLVGARVNAPMPGKILSVKVGPGQVVKRGDVLMILEAMKMENEIQSPMDGTITAIAVAEGATVDAGATLVCIG